MPKRGSVPEAPTWEDVKGREAHRLVQFARPWACLLGLLVAGAVLHKGWPYPVTAAGVLLLSGGVAALLRHFTHRRSSAAARWMAPVTVLSGAGWLVSADLAGLTRTVLGFWVIAGSAVCLVWNAWLAVRENDGGEVASLVKGAERAGIHGLKVFGIKLHPHKTEAIVRPQPGTMVAEDLIKQLPYIEAGAGMPVGSLQAAPVPSNRGHAKVTITNPRLIDAPVPWPGPSIPSGGSIADPIVPGVWQDGEPVKYTVINHHLQVMGCTGSGKTQSQLRNEAAETVTRYDAGILAWDITKQNQFLGPLRPCLHMTAVTVPEGLDAFDMVSGMAADRLQYLSERGLEKWEKGCGLTHWTLQFEEFPDFFLALEQAKRDDKMEAWTKALRSAGFRLALSLQRSDFTQMPTIMRSQMDYMCFGCKSDQDEGFGLSPRQKARNCEPSLWGDRYPGKAYLDSKSIPDDRIGMPLRCYDWGRDSRLIAAHARQYPARAKRIDPISEKWLGRLYAARPSVAPSDAPVRTGSVSDRPSGRESIRLVRPDERAPGQQASQQASQQGDRTVYPKQLPDDHDPDTWTAPGPDDLAGDGEPDKAFTVPDTPVGAWEWGGPAAASAELSAEEADAAFMEFIHECRAKGQYTITLEDLLPVRERAGKSRPWLYFIIDKKVASGVLRKSGKASWTISRVA